MIELGLAHDQELAIFGAPRETAPPSGASEVTTLDTEGQADTAKDPWREIARGIGWWTSWRRHEQWLTVGISRVIWEAETVAHFANLGNDGFVIAFVEGGKCFYARNATLIGFGSQGGRGNHLRFWISKDGGLR